MDSRLRRTLDLRFNVPFFARGDFPAQIMNNTESVPLPDPWAGRGNSAPFDRRAWSRPGGRPLLTMERHCSLFPDHERGRRGVCVSNRLRVEVADACAVQDERMVPRQRGGQALD